MIVFGAFICFLLYLVFLHFHFDWFSCFSDCPIFFWIFLMLTALSCLFFSFVSVRLSLWFTCFTITHILAETPCLVCILPWTRCGLWNSQKGCGPCSLCTVSTWTGSVSESPWSLRLLSRMMSWPMPADVIEQQWHQCQLRTWLPNDVIHSQWKKRHHPCKTHGPHSFRSVTVAISEGVGQCRNYRHHWELHNCVV